MAGPWTVSRDRPDGNGGSDLRATLGRLVTRWGLAPFVQQAWARSAGLTAASAPANAAAGLTAEGFPVAALRPPGVAAERSAYGTAGKPWSGAAYRQVTRRLSARWAIPLLALMTVAAVLMGLATAYIAERAITTSQATARKLAGPLVIPAPRLAGGYPRRFGAITDPAELAIVSQFRQRFGVVSGGLVADARKAAGSGKAAGATASKNGPAARAITADSTSGLYGEPGHLDPATYHPSWVMYLGLDASGVLGRPSATIVRLMRGLLGPYAVVGPWRVAPGHRGGSANCTVAWLGLTSVSVCGWATGHTIGALVSPVRDTSVGELAKMMIKMRFDLQQG